MLFKSPIALFELFGENVINNLHTTCNILEIQTLEYGLIHTNDPFFSFFPLTLLHQYHFLLI